MGNRSHAVSRLFYTALVLAACLALTPALASGSGRCATAEVPQAMLMPDGSLYPAGTLRVCTDRAYSPVSGMHRVYVDGAQVGLFVSRRSLSEGLADRERPFFLFLRNREGRLVLQGFAWPEKGQMHAYRMQDPRWKTASFQQRTAGLLEPETKGAFESDDLILLAASRY